jgi:hypothetical protein
MALRNLLIALIFIASLPTVSSANLIPEPSAEDPYVRIGASQSMTERELRRAYILALNRFDPNLNENTTSEQHQRILEVEPVIFDRFKSSSTVPTPAPSNVIDLFTPTEQEQEAFDHAAYEKVLAEIDEFYLMGNVKIIAARAGYYKNKISLGLGRMQMPQIRAMILAIRSLDKRTKMAFGPLGYQAVDTNLKQAAIERFILASYSIFLDDNFTYKDVLDVIEFIRTPEVRISVTALAIRFAPNLDIALDLFLNGIIYLEESNYWSQNQFFLGALALQVKKQMNRQNVSLNEIMEILFSKLIHSRQTSALALKALTPFLVWTPTENIINRLIDIQKNWILPRTARAQARRMLIYWANSKFTDEPVKQRLTQVLMSGRGPCRDNVVP